MEIHIFTFGLFYDDMMAQWLPQSMKEQFFFYFCLKYVFSSLPCIDSDFVHVLLFPPTVTNH